MTDIFHQEANAPIEQAPLDVAPPPPVKSDWSATDPAATARDVAGKNRQGPARRDRCRTGQGRVEMGTPRPPNQSGNASPRLPRKVNAIQADCKSAAP